MVLNYVLVGCPWRFIVLTEQRDQVGLISVAMKTNNLMAILDHPLCTHNFFWKQNTLDKHLTTIEGAESETFLAVLTFTCTALFWWKTMNWLCNDVSSIVLGISYKTVRSLIFPGLVIIFYWIFQGKVREGSETYINYSFMQAKCFNPSYNSG